MPKRRPRPQQTRRARRATGNAPTRPAAVDLTPAAPATRVEPAAAPQAPAPATATTQTTTVRRTAEPSVTRFTTRDYSYVKRELVRVAIIASGIIAMLIALSFFLP